MGEAFVMPQLGDSVFEHQHLIALVARADKRIASANEFGGQTHRGGRSRSSTISISPRATIPTSAPNNACWSVTRIRGFAGFGMKLLAYFGSPLFSRI
jgi:hypothetical protein